MCRDMTGHGLFSLQVHKDSPLWACSSAMTCCAHAGRAGGLTNVRQELGGHEVVVIAVVALSAREDASPAGCCGFAGR